MVTWKVKDIYILYIYVYVYMYFCLEKTYVLGGILTVDCQIASPQVGGRILGSEMLVKCNFRVLLFKESI